ncbi:MAG: hypothetical protein ACI9WS_000535, partial [Paraglaciecola psychrophila]
PVAPATIAQINSSKRSSILCLKTVSSGNTKYPADDYR